MIQESHSMHSSLVARWGTFEEKKKHLYNPLKVIFKRCVNSFAMNTNIRCYEKIEKFF